jgi:hypothetical protein
VLVRLLAVLVGVRVVMDMNLAVHTDFAFSHGIDRLADGIDEVELMGDDDAGQVQVLEHPDQVRFRVGVESGGGFVQQQDFRPHGENRGQGDHAFFPPGKLEGDAVGEPFQFQLLQGIEGRGPGLFVRLP